MTGCDSTKLQQAREKGMLVDVSAISKEAGFLFPVNLSASVWSICEDGNQEPETYFEIERVKLILEYFRCSPRFPDKYRVETILPYDDEVNPPENIGLVAYRHTDEKGTFDAMTIMRSGEDFESEYGVSTYSWTKL